MNDIIYVSTDEIWSGKVMNEQPLICKQVIFTNIGVTHGSTASQNKAYVPTLGSRTVFRGGSAGHTPRCRDTPR